MRAVASVVGKDVVGILANVSAVCARHNINIIEVAQTVLQDYFCMTMLIDFSDSRCTVKEISDHLTAEGAELGLSIHVMHEDIFKSMHRI